MSSPLASAAAAASASASASVAASRAAARPRRSRWPHDGPHFLYPEKALPSFAFEDAAEKVRAGMDPADIPITSSTTQFALDCLRAGTAWDCICQTFAENRDRAPGSAVVHRVAPPIAHLFEYSADGRTVTRLSLRNIVDRLIEVLRADYGRNFDAHHINTEVIERVAHDLFTGARDRRRPELAPLYRNDAMTTGRIAPADISFVSQYSSPYCPGRDPLGYKRWTRVTIEGVTPGSETTTDPHTGAKTSSFPHGFCPWSGDVSPLGLLYAQAKGIAGKLLHKKKSRERMLNQDYVDAVDCNALLDIVPTPSGPADSSADDDDNDDNDADDSATAAAAKEQAKMYAAFETSLCIDKMVYDNITRCAAFLALARNRFHHAGLSPPLGEHFVITNNTQLRRGCQATHITGGVLSVSREVQIEITAVDSETDRYARYINPWIEEETIFTFGISPDAGITVTIHETSGLHAGETRTIFKPWGPPLTAFERRSHYPAACCPDCGPAFATYISLTLVGATARASIISLEDKSRMPPRCINPAAAMRPSL